MAKKKKERLKTLEGKKYAHLIAGLKCELYHNNSSVCEERSKFRTLVIECLTPTKINGSKKSDFRKCYLQVFKDG